MSKLKELCHYCGKKSAYGVSSINVCGNHLTKAVNEFDQYDDVEDQVLETGVVVVSLTTSSVSVKS